MLFTEDAGNITISNEGEINGNGNLFFDPDKVKQLDKIATQFMRQKDGFRKISRGIGDGPVVPLDRDVCIQQLQTDNCKRYFCFRGPFLVYAFC